MEDKKNKPYRLDWVRAGLVALAQGGIENVRVERLAKALGVSKGPFYWRFADRNELMQAMVDYWQQELTDSLIEHAAQLESPHERLVALAEESIITEIDGLDIARTEYALRAWAAEDPIPRKAVLELDERRVAYVETEFRKLDASAEIAKQLSLAVYLALLGLYTARHYTPELASDAAFRMAVIASINEAQRRTTSND